MAVVNVRSAQQPRAHRDPAVVAAKHARLAEPHVAPLVALADAIANASSGPGTVPYPDPTFAGIRARALFLLETPAAKAAASTGGSGLLSLDNDDLTAETLYDAYQTAGLERSRTLHWNAVPWIVPGRERSALSSTHVPQAQAWLVQLISLLPDLRVVIAVGGVARDAWLRCLADRRDVPLVPTLHAPHASARGLMQPGSRQRLASVMQRAADITR
jgi:uracil-DNA glycosylase